ncbi:MAG: hypothetical protein K9K67_14995 [Bacteriovoracaceae bacterium]|nr:hypothetical protein [Bacteriovoracaceae bacterium]
MDSYRTECADELVASEQLNSFSVVEHFCEACGDLTPHHIDEPTKQPIKKEKGPILIPPMSTHECVFCREEEETQINEEEF